MADGWYIRKAGSPSKGPYTREKIASGLAKLPSLDAVEVSHASETGGRWIPASEFHRVQETRQSLAKVTPPRPPIGTELIEVEQISATVEPRATEVAIPADSRVAVQRSADGHALSRFMAEGQDPKMVAKFHRRVTDVCTREEVLEYMAIQQRPVANFSPDAVVLTNRRIMIFRQKLLGRMDMADLQWMHCRDVRIKEDIMGATITVQATNGAVDTVDWLPKPQARKVYRIAQEMEEAMVEFRRNREMEERRSGASNIVVNASTAAPSAPTPATNDPMAKLSQLKQMLDAGLITDEEFVSKKQEILSQM